MDLNSPVSIVPFVGPRFAKRLQRLNIKTVKDLLYHFPHRYQDYTLISKIAHVQPGETVTIQGQITSIKNIYTARGKKIQTAVVSDGEANIEAVWFNQPFLVRTLPAGANVSLSGKVDWFGKKRVLISPEYEKILNSKFSRKAGQIPNSTVHTGRLVPVYPETSSISSKWLRSRIAAVLPHALAKIEEFLPEQIKKQNALLDIKTAIKNVHFPENMERVNTARERLAFDELFEINLLSLHRKKEWKSQKLSHRLNIDQEKVLRFINNLPFELTESQKRACREILKDLNKEEPMNRLFEGDVGSGKTVVAALACFVAHTNGYQSVIMAPTQILAQQHFNTLNTLLGPFGVRVGLLTGEKRPPAGRSGKTLNAKRDNFDVAIGTHSLIQKGVSFDNLAFIVIDEQHRFGVAQRALLAEKGQGRSPHILTMTATPIPRTIALTMYGDLDLSTLDEMPKGRVQIKTWVVPQQKREAAYSWIRERVKETDEQAFIVCPLIEESEKETMKSVRAASAEFERLSEKVFPDLRLGLLHGRIKNEEKNKVMEKFKKGELDILVATPVVEVGIDMPDATIMLVEAAERFGLAQLHQLRGRVGRGTKQSYCLLFTNSCSDRAAARLKALERTLSGAQLAELDLKMRGPGEVYGTMQHGFPELKIASFSDFELIKRARDAAEWVIDKLDSYPRLHELVHQKQSIAPN